MEMTREAQNGEIPQTAHWIWFMEMRNSIDV